jgi:site-specific DNA-methyltransferase (adenine-specific)
MNIETLRILELTPDPNNARQHDDKNLKAIMGSLKEFGQRKPIVITEAGTIVAGNGTVEAAKRLGWTDIEVVRVPSDWTDAQVKAFAIADNRTAELANWNQEVLTSQLLELEAEGWELAEFGFEAFELPDEDKPIVEDEIPESAPGRVALGDIWQLGNHRLMCGDSFDRKQIDTLMDDQKADVVFTDPPYGMNLDADYSKMLNTKNGAAGKKHSQVIGDDLEFDPSIILDVFSYCDEILLWGFDYYADKLPQGTPLVWDKRVEEKYDAVIGSAFELLWSKKKRKRQIIRYNYTSWGARMADNLDGSKPHPTMKPVAMTVEIIKMTLGQNIVDLFGGSGSTLIAAEQTNRICYMMELDPKYCDVIIERWERLTGQKAELLPAKAD